MTGQSKQLHDFYIENATHTNDRQARGGQGGEIVLLVAPYTEAMNHLSETSGLYKYFIKFFWPFVFCFLYNTDV